MATITTKYDVGDVVWLAESQYENRTHPCPDCLGTRTWQAVSPAGRGYVVDCPRCNQGWPRRGASLDYYVHVPIARSLTIGLVTLDFDYDTRSAQLSYMCRETGIGSGSIYRETRLHDTEKEAMDAALWRTMWLNIGFAIDCPANHINSDIRFPDYQIDTAAVKTAEAKVFKAEYALERVLGELQDAYGDGSDSWLKSEVHQILERHNWLEEEDA